MAFVRFTQHGITKRAIFIDAENVAAVSESETCTQIHLYRGSVNAVLIYNITEDAAAAAGQLKEAREQAAFMRSLRVFGGETLDAFDRCVAALVAKHAKKLDMDALLKRIEKAGIAAGKKACDDYIDSMLAAGEKGDSPPPAPKPPAKGKRVAVTA